MILGHMSFDGLGAIGKVAGARQSPDGRVSLITTSGGLTYNATGGRGNGGYITGTFNGSGIVRIELPSALTELWLHAAFAATVGSQTGFVQFADASGVVQLTVQRNAAGLVEIRRGTAAGTLLATGSLNPGAALSALALQVKFDATTGILKLREGGAGTLAVDLTGQNTQGGTGGCKYINMGAYAGGLGYVKSFDDLIWGDTTGSVNNTLPPGDRRVILGAAPSSDVSVDFTRSAGSTNVENVDEAAANDDTDYNESSTVGHQDKLGVSLSLTGQAIIAAGVRVIAKGGGNVKLGLDGSGDTEDISPTAMVTDPSSYHGFGYTIEVDPDTSAAWIPSGIHAVNYLVAS